MEKPQGEAQSSLAWPLCGRGRAAGLSSSHTAGVCRKATCLLASTLLAVSLMPAAGLAPQAQAAEDAANASQSAQAMTQDRIDEANNAYNNAATNLTFITMSDTEFGGNATDDKTAQEVAYEAKVGDYRTIAEWANVKGFDIQAVVDNGDVIGANEAEYYAHLDGDSAKPADWYRAVEQAFSENFGDAYMMFTQGNHDIADLMGDVFDEKHANDEKWVYPNDDTDNVGNWHVNINGYDFIGLDYNGSTTFGYGGQQSGYQDFLRATLEEISSAPDYDPGKPIFVNVHSGYVGTSLGGPFHGTYDTAGPDLQSILADYPQVLVGSAHTHFSVEPETSIYQKDFTFYENGSMNYIYQDVPGDFLGGGYFDGDQGSRGENEKTCNFVSILEDGSTVIRRFDVTHERWIGMPWVIDTTQGAAGFNYTDDQRSTVAPWWEEGALLTAANVTETSATIGFDQAADDQLVNYYEISIADALGNPVQFTVNQVPDWGGNDTESFTGSFKAYSRWYMEPNTMGFDLTDLEPATTYTVTVRAYDDFQNESAEPLVGTFRTAGELTFPEFPEESTPVEGIEEGQYFDMSFEGDLSDAISGATGTANGSVEFVDSYNEQAGQAVRIASGAGNYVDLGNRDEWNLGTDKDITINFWINVESCGGYSAFISNKDWTNWWRKGINVGPQSSDTTKVEFTLGDDVSGGGAYCTGDVPNYVGAWHMMTVSVDRENQLARTYFDGELKQTTDISSIGDMTSNLSMYLGVDAGRAYGNTTFAMDDLDMWDRPLSDEEVSSLFASADATAAQREALDDALKYAIDLRAQIEVGEEGGRVYDDELTAALDAAINGAQDVADDAIREAFDALKTAVLAVESQPVVYTVESTGENGVVAAASATVEEGSDAVFALAPNEGYQIEGSDISVTAGLEYEVSGAQLIVHNVTGPVQVHVSFAKISDQDGDNPGSGDQGGDNQGGDNPGSGDQSGDNQGDGGQSGQNPGDGAGQGDGNGSGNGSGSDAGNGSDPSDNGQTSSDQDNGGVFAKTNDGMLQVFVALCGVLAAAATGLVIAWRKLRRF